MDSHSGDRRRNGGETAARLAEEEVFASAPPRLQAIGHSRNKYTDVFTSLLEALFLDFNFDQAQKHISSLGEVRLDRQSAMVRRSRAGGFHRTFLRLFFAQVCESDFFLKPLKDAVNEYARLLIFETYCRIHKRINVE